MKTDWRTVDGVYQYGDRFLTAEILKKNGRYASFPLTIVALHERGTVEAFNVRTSKQEAISRYVVEFKGTELNKMFPLNLTNFRFLQKQLGLSGDVLKSVDVVGKTVMVAPRVVPYKSVFIRGVRIVPGKEGEEVQLPKKQKRQWGHDINTYTGKISESIEDE